MCRTYDSATKTKVKVTLPGHVIYLVICVHAISPQPFERFSLNFTQMFLLVRRCTEHMSQLPRLKVKVKGFTLEILVRFISPERFRRFSLNSTKMFFSLRRRAEPMTQLCRLKVIVMIYLSMRVRSISP